MTSPSFRDVEQLSALLDEQLHPQEAARLQERLNSDPELAAIYRQLSQARTLLRKLPARRAPRNFTLTPHMVGVKAPAPRSFTFFRLASAFASLLLLLTFVVNGLGQRIPTAPSAAPAYGMGGGPIAENMEAPAAPESRPQSGGGAGELPAPEATAAPATDAAVPTEETLRSMVAVPTETTQEQPAAKMGGEDDAADSTPHASTRPSFQVPAWLQLVLLGLAVLTGVAAWLVNRQAQANFTRRFRK
ncbi:MAG: hypothetical protein DDG60_14870 [Anaerolineae bacterium]|nr:MAG: hypothetical protein DDG60_14870 [Anaerolineae bacterium]